VAARAPGDPRDLRADPRAPLTVVRAGRVDYATAWAWQRDLAVRRARDEVGDVLLLLEHPPVYTLGRRADETNLVTDAAWRDARGITVHEVDRGGDVTYHGPGQLVGYPIWRLDGPRVVDHVRALEAINLALLADLGVTGHRVEGFSGVWVADPAGGPDAKVTAVGVHVTAGYVTTHGWATNVATDLDHFTGIVPCGIDDKPVASLRSLGVEVDLDGAVERTVTALESVLDAPTVDAPLSAYDLTRPPPDSLAST
jgi:lipoyl(octanoyl) transferase